MDFMNECFTFLLFIELFNLMTLRISNKADKLFPKYGLYAYSEGRLTSKARSMYFDGIPVLFIPGNAGSYKQVRSLSSVALRKAINSRSSFHFDYFTIDFNDEFSGLYGPLLYEELSYVNSSLYRIFELYRERKNKPTSIVLIGHSMGGVIARNLLSQISDPNIISVLIALAVPVKRAPLVLDYHMHNFYESTDWKMEGTVNTTVISLSGGYSDFLIPTYLTDIPKNTSLSAVTSNIPRCWIETNHIQITWCKQVILAINRALFHSVDSKMKQLSLNSTYRNIAFKQYIIDDSGTKVQNHDSSFFETIKIDYRGQWIENVLRQYSAQFFNGIKEPHWQMVRLTSLPAHEMLSVLAINLEVVDWIFACNANFPRGSSRVCTDAIHLTQLSKIWPSAKYKRRYFEINMHQLQKNNSELTHIVFRALPTKEPIVFHVDVYKLAERRMTINLPKWWSLKKQVILGSTPEKAVNYEFILPQLQHVIQYYELFVDPINCASQHHHASASLIVPWSNQNHHNYFIYNDKTSLKVRLHSSKPYENTQAVIIKLILEPSCTYQISMKPSIVGMLGQITRFYTPLLLTNIAAVILMALKYQLRSLKDGQCSIIFVAIKEGAKPYYILTIAKIVSNLFSGAKLLKFLPKSDVSYLIDDGIDFLLLPLLLYMCSVGIVLLLAAIFSISLITLQSTVHKLALKLLARTVSFNVVWSDYLISALHKVPFIVAGSLILICFSTCGGLALCLGTIFYFLKLTQMSQDYVEEVVWLIIKKVAKSCKNMFSKKKRNTYEKIEENDDILKSNAIEAVETLTNEDRNKKGHVTDKLPEFNDEIRNDELVSDTSIGDLRNQDNKKLVTKNTDSEDEKKIEMHTDTEDKNIKVLKKVNKTKNRITKESEDKNEGGIDESPHSIKKNVKDENKHKNEKQNHDYDNQLSSAYNSIFFHSTLFFIWCIITIINVPAVLTWAHNFKFSNSLTPDDSFIPGLALSLCALPLWQFEFPKIGRKWIDKLEIFVMIIAVVSLTFATISVYRLNYLLSLTMVTITLHQLIAPKSRDHVESIDGDINDEPYKEKYENIKTKMD